MFYVDHVSASLSGMDRAVSSSFTPIVLARLLSQLPSKEVEAIEAWVVDEKALPSAAAARLFGALRGVQQAGGFLQERVDDVRVGAEELWQRLSEEFAQQPGPREALESAAKA